MSEVKLLQAELPLEAPGEGASCPPAPGDPGVPGQVAACLQSLPLSRRGLSLCGSNFPLFTGTSVLLDEGPS